MSMLMDSMGEAASFEPMPAPKITIKDLRFFYKGDVAALKGIDLDLAEKRVTAFIGPSGCGKSTLLRVLNRIYDLYPGSTPPAKCCSTGATFSNRPTI